MFAYNIYEHKKSKKNAAEEIVVFIEPDTNDKKTKEILIDRTFEDYKKYVFELFKEAEKQESYNFYIYKKLKNKAELSNSDIPYVLVVTKNLLRYFLNFLDNLEVQEISYKTIANIIKTKMNLTKAEIQNFEYLEKGCKIEEIADKLHKSSSTVKNQNIQLLHKLRDFFEIDKPNYKALIEELKSDPEKYIKKSIKKIDTF